MTSADLPDVLAIERASFTFPWSAGFFVQELKIDCARSHLAVVDGKPAGYVIYWLLSREMDIHNLAVAPAYRRRGIAHALLQAVIADAVRERANRITLEVRKSNEAAQRLYHSAGFMAKGVRKGYYSDDGEDALVMVLEFGHRR